MDVKKLPESNGEESDSSYEFLDDASIAVAGPLQLNMIQLQDLLDTAYSLPQFSLQSIHLVRALWHFTLRMDRFSEDPMFVEECMQLQSMGDDLEGILSRISKAQITAEATVSRQQLQKDLDKFFSRISKYAEEKRGIAGKEIQRSGGTYLYLQNIELKESFVPRSAQFHLDPVKPLLICVFVHGFKGDDSTFQDFPSRLARDLEGMIGQVIVESLFFPAYETKNDLNDTVERFVEWLQDQVLEREINRTFELGGSPLGQAEVVLCGHSTGGLVISDALLTMQRTQSGDESPWPKIIALITYDTPYLGLHPDLLNSREEKDTRYASTSLRRRSSQGPSWESLAAIGGSTVVASAIALAVPLLMVGAAAFGAATLYTRGKAISGQAFVEDHFRYVGNLRDEAAMMQRLNDIVATSKTHRILFRAFYTYLPRKPDQTKPRTFIILPLQTDPSAPYFVPAENEQAENELDTHIGMFAAKTNSGYYELGRETARLIRDSILWYISENGKTMKVDREDSDATELAENRTRVGRDGREAQATRTSNGADGAPPGNTEGNGSI